jgi:hypothetical protein
MRVEKTPMGAEQKFKLAGKNILTSQWPRITVHSICRAVWLNWLWHGFGRVNNANNRVINRLFAEA